MFAKHLLKVSKVLRGATPRNASKAPSSPFADGGIHSTMNDLPIPEGDWQEHYNRRNLKNSAVLFVGIGSLISSLYMHFTDEVINWNYKVPVYDRCV
ncbi:uncharacterized protein LOC105215625 [Zeugodacus cucurbitae]|uniref:uncharacterized protein LOC105215625 n=1 Tax=Zeugodacus cucurbitae TaxID=28588 RepID=UPI0005968C86|nr:uncharacterized protein LOC105215625 [Zeugodacus cucurbitae]